MSSNYAVCWIGYKMRPFLEKCIVSISRNKKFDTYAYIDNCGDEAETNKVKDLFLKYFPNANIVVRPVNYKLDLNVICAMNETFSKGYDGIFYCEDDIFFDDTAFETLENLAEWAKINVPEAAVFHSWNYDLKKEDYPKQYEFYFNNHRLQELDYNDQCSFQENEVGFTGQNHWGALIMRKAWDVISPYILRHYHSYLKSGNVSMNSFDFDNILNIISKAVCISNMSNEYKKRMFSRFDIKGWEAIYEWALCANGLLRLALTKPRSMCIENEGTDFNSKSFEMLGLDKIKLGHFENAPKDFILNQKSKQLFMK